MNSKLQHLFDSLETQRQNLLGSLKNLPAEKLNAHAEGKWSINQILAHITTAERMSVQYIGKKIQGVEQTEDSGIYEEIKMLLLISSQRLPLKFKAPKKVVEQTSPAEDVNQLIKEWDIVRFDLKKILEQVEDRHIKRKIYKHVRVGMLNIQQALKFLREHIIHHTPQIKRLL